MEAANLKLRVSDLGVYCDVRSERLNNGSPFVSYQVVGRDSVDTLTNKNLLSPTNQVAATALSVGGSVLPITDGAVDTVLTRTGVGATFAPSTATALLTTGGLVNVSAAGLPNIGQTLVASDSTHLVWTDLVHPYNDLTTAIGDATDPTIQLRFNAAGTTAIAGSQTANRVVTLPNATDTLVGKATTDTLTNKIIIGATNTVSANSLKTNGVGVVTTTGAAPPSVNQILRATSATTAGWSNETVTTLSSTGGNYALVSNGTGPGLSVRGLTQGMNVNIEDNGSALTVHYDGSYEYRS
jgi:hypothetical protein